MSVSLLFPFLSVTLSLYLGRCVDCAFSVEPANLGLLRSCRCKQARTRKEASKRWSRAGTVAMKFCDVSVLELTQNKYIQPSSTEGTIHRSFPLSPDNSSLNPKSRAKISGGINPILIIPLCLHILLLFHPRSRTGPHGCPWSVASFQVPDVLELSD